MLLTVQRDLKLVSECFASQTARKGAIRGSVYFHENRGIRQQTIAFAILILSLVSFFLLISITWIIIYVYSTCAFSCLDTEKEKIVLFSAELILISIQNMQSVIPVSSSRQLLLNLC